MLKLTRHLIDLHQPRLLFALLIRWPLDMDLQRSSPMWLEARLVPPRHGQGRREQAELHLFLVR